MKDDFIEFLKNKWGKDRVLHICTFKTEGTKSAILTSARGMGINDDMAHEIADLVKVERGKLWTIDECINGNEEKGRLPDKIFIRKMQEYPNLLETIQEIEGLICGRSIHASGVIVFNDSYIEQNALMKAPNGLPITCWDMKDSNETGCLKIDLLVTEGIEKIYTTLKLLLEDEKIEWKGNLKDTYDFYLHPDRIDYNNKELWDLLCKNEIIDLFQFSSAVGVECISKTQPRSVAEMSTSNALTY